MDEHRECPDCAEEIKRAAKVCRFCGWGRKSSGRVPRARRRYVPPKKSGGVAFMLAAFLPMGSGHVYAGEPGRAVVVFFSAVFVGLGAILASGYLRMDPWPFWLVVLLIYVAQVADAIAATGRANEKTAARRR